MKNKLALGIFGAIFVLSNLVMAEKLPERISVNQQLKAERQQQFQKQREENMAFRESLKNMTPEQRNTAVKEHREKQFQENQDLRQKLHAENITYVKERLAKNTKLTDAQKEELVNVYESQYQGAVVFRDKNHEEAMANFEKVANDQELTQEQKKETLKQYAEARKVKVKEFMKQSQGEKKTIKQQIKSERKLTPLNPIQTEAPLTSTADIVQQ